MDVLRFKTSDTVVELEWETFHKRGLKRWWTSFSSNDWAYIKKFLGDATSLFRTSLDWHLLEAIIVDTVIYTPSICMPDLENFKNIIFTPWGCESI